MAKVVELKGSAKTHLQGLASEIDSLVGHAQPVPRGSAPTCWAKNTEDVNIALTVLRAVSLAFASLVWRPSCLYPSPVTVERMKTLAHSTFNLGVRCRRRLACLLLCWDLDVRLMMGWCIVYWFFVALF